MITDEDIKLAKKIQIELNEYLRTCLPQNFTHEEYVEKTYNFIILKIAKLTNMLTNYIQ
jgi:hypothetical protein